MAGAKPLTQHKMIYCRCSSFHGSHVLTRQKSYIHAGVSCTTGSMQRYSKGNNKTIRDMIDMIKYSQRRNMCRWINGTLTSINLHTTSTLRRCRRNGQPREATLGSGHLNLELRSDGVPVEERHRRQGLSDCPQ